MINSHNTVRMQTTPFHLLRRSTCRKRTGTRKQNRTAKNEEPYWLSTLLRPTGSEHIKACFSPAHWHPCKLGPALRCQLRTAKVNILDMSMWTVSESCQCNRRKLMLLLIIIIRRRLHFQTVPYLRKQFIVSEKMQKRDVFETHEVMQDSC